MEWEELRKELLPGLHALFGKPHGKVCVDCDRFKEYEEYHRHPNTKDRYANSCRECRNRYMREHRRKMKAMEQKTEQTTVIEALPDIGDHWEPPKPTKSHKECLICGLQRPISYFALHPQTWDGYLNTCVTCTYAKRYGYPIDGRDYRKKKRKLKR